MNHRISVLNWILICLITIIGYSCNNTRTGDPVKDSFINPPDSSRPGVYWYFMDGNLNREGMTRDLESMKKAGIGYVLFLEVNVGVPRGKIDFLSDQWQELYRHAVKEAERLGIRIILGSGPGWAGSGGPWVSPEQSMIHLVASDTTVTGPSVLDCALPLPKPLKPFFGEGSVPKNLKDEREKWYEDTYVLAFPAPEKKELIEGIQEKALYYRAPYTSQKGVKPFLSTDIIYPEIKGSSIAKDKILDLTAFMQKEGRLKWDVPRGKWTIMRFVKRNNGAVTRPAPAPGLGFESDKFDTVSFDAHYNAYLGKLINKVKPVKSKTGGGWTMIHIDSWEMGSQNWTNNFREEFRKRRGYDLLQYLPVYKGLIVSSPEISERFLWDIRQTSNELIIENHAGRFRELGRRSGFRLSIEPYDMNPASDIDLGSVADIPMCEFWSDGYGFNSSFSCIEATSIAHIIGAPVVAAESFTADNTEAWKKYPGDMKNQGDWAFCMGINRLIYHTFAHKPFDDKYRPGMTMGPYGVHWDRGQTWWPMVTAYHKYITRCQYMLSQGKAVSDILYLTPEGAPQVFLPPASSLEGTAVMPDKKGFSFDGCSPKLFISKAEVKDNQIVFPGGASYRILVLPQIKTMTPELITKIASLIKDGAVVLGYPPVRSPSLSGYPECDTRVIEIADSLWGTGDMPDGMVKRSYGKGILWWGKDFTAVKSYNPDAGNLSAIYPDFNITTSLLLNEGINPDFRSGGDIRYSHRSLSDREIYFISNRTGRSITDTCYFRNGTSDAEIWDAINGETFRAGSFKISNGTTGVSVSLAPYQSFFMVFYHEQRSQERIASNSEKFSGKKIAQVISGPWKVSFDEAWGGPANIQFDSLSDWSMRNEEGIKYYSGIAKYTKTFDYNDFSLTNKKSKIYIDLGKVRNIARVKLNGKDLGIIWTAPWCKDITDVIFRKGNRLEIEVANLWINRLIGDENLAWDGVVDGKWPEWLVNGTPRVSKRYTFTTHHFYKKGDPLSESGLIGPVKIRTSN